jgi:hypothetical protein
MTNISATIDRMLDDSRHGWSIGTFGAIGEFMRDEDEPFVARDAAGVRTLVTTRGGIRVAPTPELTAIAYDTLSSDGETWGQSVAFCLPRPAEMDQGVIRALGPDADALREEDRGHALFDLGVGRGHVRMHLRTADAALIAALEALEGKPLFGPEAAGVMDEVLRAQPHRVMTSPAGRVEVYSPIPAPGGESPAGPHTHLLPKMLASGRTHAANAPIPDGLQPVLLLHPRSPWRDEMGRRVEFDPGLDALFGELLDSFGLPDDRAVGDTLASAIRAGAEPSAFAWPDSRRGRTKARITLRRLAHDGLGREVADWRSLYDRTPADAEDEAAQ